MALDLGNYALDFAKDDDVSVANLTTKLGQLAAGTIDFGSSTSTHLNVLGDITSGGLIITQYIQHDNDGNTSFGFPTDDTFRVITGGTTRLNIGGGVELTGNTTVTGDIIVTGTVDGVDIAALNTTVAGLGAPSWASITSKPTTISGFGITDGLTTDFNTNATAEFTGTAINLGAPGDFKITNLIQTGTNPGTDLVVGAGSACGTDQSGGNLELHAGNSTGSTYSGDISFWGNGRTGSSSNVNTAVQAATFLMNDATPRFKLDAITYIEGPDAGRFEMHSHDDLILRADNQSDNLGSEIKFQIQSTERWTMHDDGTQYGGTALDLGANATVNDATLTRDSAGDLAIEGNIIYRAGGTDVPIADGGTGASTLAAAKTALEIPVDLTVDGAGTVHANNYTDTNTTYSLATNTVSGLCQVYNSVEEDSIVCDSEDPPTLRRYKVQHDVDTDLSVCVPWTDTTYTHPTGAGNEHLPSAVSQTEAGYLDGVTSAIQTQLDTKLAEADALALIDSDTMAGASATNVASAESVKAYADRPAKQLQFIYANWKDTTNYGVDELFIPLAAQPEEMTAFAKEQSAIVMATSGYVKEIICRTNGMHADAIASVINWKVYTRPKNKKMNGSSQVGATIAMDPPPTELGTNDTNTVTTGDLGTTYPYNKWDALGISMEWEAKGTEDTDRVWVTVVLENDLTSLGY